MHESVLSFWFEEITPKQRWVKDPEFDALITKRFGTTHARATRGELWEWRETPEGRLAEIILFDQFSRNMFRDTPEAFAYDTIALVLAQEMVAQGSDQEIDESRRAFVYMPYMHSESKEVHTEALRLFEAFGNPDNLKYEHMHKEIIDRFGRYPHRNTILGRESTEEEEAFLELPGSSF